MAIYTYSNGSLIDEIEILTNEKGGMRAYIHARNDITPDQISAVHQGLTSHGWFGMPMQHRGRAVLELRGFRKPEELTRYLETQGYVQNAATIAQTKEDKVGFWDKFKSFTLKYTGWAYIVGDAAFMTYAGMEQWKHFKDLKKAENLSEQVTRIFGKPSGEQAILSAKANIRSGWYKLLSGVGYAIGSVILANYGSRDQSHIEIKKSVQKIDRFLKVEGLSSPDERYVLKQEQEKKNPNLLERANGLLRRYPSEALNVVYTGVGLALARSSLGLIKEIKKEVAPTEAILKRAVESEKARPHVVKKYQFQLQKTKKNLSEETIDVGLGAVTASSALAGILIKEKKPVEGQKKRGFFEGGWIDWIQEQPLRLTGYGYMLATGFHAVATFRKWMPDEMEKEALEAKKLLQAGQKLGEKPARIIEEFNFRHKTLTGRAVFIAANIAAEILMILSSKGHGEGVRNADVDESVIASTAEYISRQNPATHEQLIERLAGYMSAPEVLGMKAETIATNLREQVSAMKANPWAHGVHQAATSETSAALEHHQALTMHKAGPVSQVESVKRDGIIQDQQLVAAVGN